MTQPLQIDEWKRMMRRLRRWRGLHPTPNKYEPHQGEKERRKRREEAP